MKTQNNLKTLFAKAKRRLRLHEGATNFVFGSGNPDAQIMIIGEAPGKDEDAQGEPFVGAAGKLLNEAIVQAGMKRSDLYITNTVKSRPPKNRKPTIHEIRQERELLLQEIALVKPRAICTLGATAYYALFLRNSSITRERKQNPHTFETIPVIVTIHPAYAKRKPSEKITLIQDLQLVQRFISTNCG